jgi:hypothetical protein
MILMLVIRLAFVGRISALIVWTRKGPTVGPRRDRQPPVPLPASQRSSVFMNRAELWTERRQSCQVRAAPPLLES